jgi:ectoine hydroxylase-related dioxygenase (phytanoyl-CoA dioxygenase family)
MALSSDMKSQSYGVTRQQEIHSETERHLEELSVLGFSVVPDVLDAALIKKARLALDSIYDQQEQEFGKDNLNQIEELNLVRCPLAYDPMFLMIATQERVLDIVRPLIGSYIQLHLQNGILNMPGQPHHQSSWHRDLPYQDFVISHPIAVSALFCIDDFTSETGATFVIPYSHKLEIMPSTAFVEKHQYSVHARSGAAIVFDSLLYHRAGFNSSGYPRRGINHVYSVPLLKQQMDMPRLLKGKYAENEFHRKLLGYESQVAESVIDYRQKKSARSIAKP